MKLSEELIWRGFYAKTTIEDPTELDEKKRKFYLGADPSADSLTIGNLAALMMASCFVRHGYEPFLLVGGATGQIGDPKETGERDLKSLDEVERNKRAIGAQMKSIVRADNLVMVDNYDWFKEIKFLDFLREIGKTFSMTQLLDRQFVQARIGEGGSGISYAEFSYSLIQGYDFLYLFRKYGVDLQLCGADQFGNGASGIHLIKRLENAKADVWSTPLIIDPITGRKFGKSEGNAIWLDAKKTNIFDFYQFWLGQPDASMESLIKIYTIYSRDEVCDILDRHSKTPEERLAQKMLARGATSVVHGEKKAILAEKMSEILFKKEIDYSFFEDNIDDLEGLLPVTEKGVWASEILVKSGISSSKSEARRLMSGGGVSFNNEKITEDKVIEVSGLIRKGKNKFILIR